MAVILAIGKMDFIFKLIKIFVLQMKKKKLV